MANAKWLAVLALCAVGAEAYAEPRFRVTKVATEDPSCSFSPGDAFDLNDTGAVIGRRCIDDRLYAFVVHKGVINVLPQDREGTAGFLRLNDRYDLILSVSSQQEGERNLLVLNDGTTVRIDPPKGDLHLDLIGLNNRRQVLAWTKGPSHPSGQHSILWQNGRATPLDAPPGSFSSTAFGLNDTGVAIGYSSSTPGEALADLRAVLWEGGTVMPLPLPPKAIGARGRDINNRGQAALSVYFEGGATRAYLWQQGAFKALPLLPIGDFDSAPGSAPSDINNLGQVVGTTSHRNELRPDMILRATLWSAGAAYELQKLLVDGNGEPVTNLRLRRALAINDRGQILVDEFSNFVDHPEYFVLTPVR
jgi:hypothetical protein